MTKLAAIILSLAVASGVARADQVALPGYAIPAAELERFVLCRAAVFYHLDGPEDPASRVPRPVARTLGDQIDFIAAETLVGRPVADTREGQRLSQFMEQFILGFAKGLSRYEARLRDVAERDAALLDCVPYVWMGARGMIEQLAAWRFKAIDPPRFADDAEYDVFFSDLARRLGLPPRDQPR